MKVSPQIALRRASTNIINRYRVLATRLRQSWHEIMEMSIKLFLSAKLSIVLMKYLGDGDMFRDKILYARVQELPMGQPIPSFSSEGN